MIDASTLNEPMNFSYYDTVSALDAYVIHVQPYEGQSWLLASRKTGVKAPLSALPVVSPDKQQKNPHATYPVPDAQIVHGGKA